jgi:uncharacterized membrane protein YphA (DoxX/SURF4 family)
MKQIMLGYFFRVVRMILVIFTISYFIGTLWFIFCWQLYTKSYDSQGDDSFIGLFKFNIMLKEG